MLSKLIPLSKYVIILSGDGVLGENYQKNYRTEGFSLWELEDFLRFASPDMIRRSRGKLEYLYNMCLSELEKYKQNKIHEILVKWEADGFIKGIITENVEGLHQTAGSKRVFEIYGTMKELYCTDCGMKYPMYKYYSDNPTICDCGGFVRPGIIMSYEHISKDRMEVIREEILKADLIIALGYSFKDGEVTSSIKKVKERGGSLVIIDDKASAMDEYAELVIRNVKLSQSLKMIDEELKSVKLKSICR